MVSAPLAPLPKRVLVIEDEDDIREVARVSLEAFGGYEVLTAATGRDGLRVARECRPDAILLDVMMPEMTGLQVVEALLAEEATREIPVVLLTATPGAQTREALTRLGVTRRITKPFDPVELSGLLATEVGWEDAKE